MKKTKLLTSIAALALVLGLGACETNTDVDDVTTGGDESSSETTTDTTTGGGEHEHTWGEWETEVAATCEADGVQKRTCTVCGEEETDTLPATGHQPGTEIVEKDEYGHYYECTVCGYLILEDHTFTGDTYVDEYYHSNTCTVCQYGGNHVHEAPSTTNSVCACGQSLNTTGFSYEYSEEYGGYLVSSYTQPEGDTSTEKFIPAYYDDGLPIVGIKKGANNNGGVLNQTGITSIGLPSTFVYIGDYAFGVASGNGTLSRVNIPTHLVEIGGYAFKYCSLTDVTFAQYGDLTTIGIQAFNGVSYTQTHLQLPDHVETIGSSAFQKVTGIKTVDLGKSVKTLGTSAFSLNTNDTLDWVIIPNTIESMGAGAFSTGLGAVYYLGTEAEWALVDTNTVFTTATPGTPIYYYSETQASGCWYYGEDGAPTLW